MTTPTKTASPAQSVAPYGVYELRPRENPTPGAANTPSIWRRMNYEESFSLLLTCASESDAFAKGFSAQQYAQALAAGQVGTPFIPPPIKIDPDAYGTKRAAHHLAKAIISISTAQGHLSDSANGLDDAKRAVSAVLRATGWEFADGDGARVRRIRTATPAQSSQ